MGKGWRTGPDGVAVIRFHVNPTPPTGSRLPPQHVHDAIQEATAVWEVANPRLDFRFEGFTDREPRQKDGFSDFSYGSSVVVNRDADGFIIEADIIRTAADTTDSLTYTTCDWRREGGCANSGSGKVEVLDMLVHEVGHVVGLDDLRTEDARQLTMYTWGQGPGSRQRVTLGRGDLLGLHTLYPCNCAPPPVYEP